MRPIQNFDFSSNNTGPINTCFLLPSSFPSLARPSCNPFSLSKSHFLEVVTRVNVASFLCSRFVPLSLGAGPECLLFWALLVLLVESFFPLCACYLYDHLACLWCQGPPESCVPGDCWCVFALVSHCRLPQFPKRFSSTNQNPKHRILPEKKRQPKPSASEEGFLLGSSPPTPLLRPQTPGIAFGIRVPILLLLCKPTTLSWSTESIFLTTMRHFVQTLCQKCDSCLWRCYAYSAKHNRNLV